MQRERRLHSRTSCAEQRIADFMGIGSALRTTAKRLRNAWRDSLRIADRAVHRLLYRRAPALLARYRFRTILKRRLDLKAPSRFDEKLAWLMLYWRHPLKTVCADKLAVREYVSSRGFGQLLPAVHSVYRASGDIDFDSLPKRFVLKCTHGSRFNVFCLDKAEINVGAVRSQLDAWLARDFSDSCGELHYVGITPRILCEEYLGEPNGNLPRDYKMSCFHGRVQFTMVCSGRRVNGRAGWFDYYDRDWREKLPYSKAGLHPERQVPKPAAYDLMRAAAESLSKPFPFVRVDFYCVNDRPYFGEMTFTPSGCADKGYADAIQALGALITLPAPYP